MVQYLGNKHQHFITTLNLWHGQHFPEGHFQQCTIKYIKIYMYDAAITICFREQLERHVDESRLAPRPNSPLDSIKLATDQPQVGLGCVY